MKLKTNLGLIDADPNVPDASPIFTRSYGGAYASNSTVAQLTNGAGVAAAMTHMLRFKNAPIVLNLGAGSGTGDGLAGMLLPLRKKIDRPATMVFAAGIEESSIALFASVRKQLGRAIDRYIFVRNLRESRDSIAGFAIWENSSVREEFLAGDGVEIEVPYLEDVVRNPARAAKQSIGSLMATTGVYEFGEALFAEVWFREVFDQLAAAGLGDDLTIVSGGKGGVGKSLVAATVFDYFALGGEVPVWTGAAMTAEA